MSAYTDISQMNAVQQKLYMLLAGRKGSFLYDRELGSHIFQVSPTDDNCIPAIEANARLALEMIPHAEVVGVSIENQTVSVSVELDGQIYETQIQL